MEYYVQYYKNQEKATPAITLSSGLIPILEKDAVQILQMHLKNSQYDFDTFTKKIEDWYDDSMNRVSGWYKRQTQFILLLIGLVLAIIFNVDVVQIANKLSVDKDARAKLVQMAEHAVDKYKDDPNVKKVMTKSGEYVPDNTDSNIVLYRKYNASLDSVKQQLEGDVKTSNEIIAAGWGDYGRKKTRELIFKEYNIFIPQKNGKEMISHKYDSCLNVILDNNWIRTSKMYYVLSQTFHWKKFLGFLILAFAVSLGAPFWFDLLNKLVNIRAAGKKEDASSSTGNVPVAVSPPISVTVNPQNTGEEAIG